MKKKRILFMIESLALGGAEKSLVTVLNNLDYSKYEIDLLLINKNGVFHKFLPNEVKVIYYDIFNGVNKFDKTMARIKFYLFRVFNTTYNTAHYFWKSYGNLIPKHSIEYDTAIAYSQGFATYFIEEKTTVKNKYAWVNTDYQKAGYNAQFDKKFYKKYRGIVCVSKEAKKSFISAFKNLTHTTELTVIKDIIDDKVIKSKALERTNVFPKSNITTTILTVGRLADAKGIPLAIEACHLLINKGYAVNWFVIGEGPKRNEIENLIRSRGIQDSFHLLGFKENPYPYFKECDIYVQTSLFEGLGMTVIEASFLYKPIVTTNFITATSLISHNKTGLICEMNAQAIADAIQQYFDNPGLVDKVTNNLKQLDNRDKEISLQKINKLLAD